MPYWINTHGGFAMQVSVLFTSFFTSFAVILVLFCPHLDSFSVPVRVLPFRFSFVDDHGVG